MGRAPLRSFSRRRAFFVVLSLVVGFFFLAVYVGFIQVRSYLEHDALRTALSIQLRSLPPTRGSIYDRHGQPIASSRPAYEVKLNLHAFRADKDHEKKLEELIKALWLPREFHDQTKRDKATLLHEKRAEFFEKILSKEKKAGRKGRKDASTILDPALPPQRHAWLNERESENRYPWISAIPTTVRFYPLGKSLAHFLGHVGLLTEKQWLAFRQNSPKNSGCSRYRLNSEIGIRGIERMYDQLLRGCYGHAVVLTDRMGYVRREASRKPPVSGGNVHLTIDAGIQSFAHDAFIAVTGGQHSGVVIVSKPQTGELLAILSYPAFDPGNYTADFAGLEIDSRGPLYNRATKTHVPPSSIFKLVVAAAALSEGIIQRSTPYECRGVFRLGRDRFHCMKREGHGKITFYDAIKKSCNIYFFNLGKELGWDTIYAYARSFGLDGAAGLDIGGERPARLMSRRDLKKNMNRTWTKGDTIVASIGQGYVEFSPLQIHGVMSLLAADGKRMRPFLVQSTTDAAKQVQNKGAFPEPFLFPEDRKPISPAVIQILKKAIFQTTEKGGTAWWYAGRIPGVKIAGKTGTGENPHGEDHAWFSAYAPADRPLSDETVAITVLVENIGTGGRFASPIAAAIFRYIFDREQYDDDGLMKWSEEDGSMVKRSKILEKMGIHDPVSVEEYQIQQVKEDNRIWEDVMNHFYPLKDGEEEGAR